MSPYIALVVPYWCLTGATALLTLKVLGWWPKRDRRPQVEGQGEALP